MTENNVALISKCMKALRTSVGVVDTEKFLFLMRSEAFDYTKWQRDYFDALKMRLTSEELGAVISDEEAVMGPTRLDYPHYFIGSKPAKLFIGSEEYEVKSWISVARIVLAQVNATRRNELRKMAGVRAHLFCHPKVSVFCQG